MKKKKIIMVVGVLALCGLIGSANGGAWEFDEAHFAASPPPLPQGVEVATDEDRNALRITYLGNEPVSIPLFEVIRPEVDGALLTYTARLSGRDVKAPAYLEMLCTLPGGAGPYFARALDSAITGSVDWTEGQAPFRFEAGQVPERVTLGVRMEGPGTIWLDGVRLATVGGAESVGVSRGILWVGPLLGVLGGVYGILAGVLAPRGKARRFVLTFHVLTLSACVVMLLAGFVFLLQNKPYAQWYPCLLSGIIGTAVFGGLWGMIKRTYMAAEMRRMQAADMSRS